MWINLTMAVSALSIQPVYSQISVPSTGALPFAAGTLATSLYASVQNTGNGTGRFTVTPTGCSGAGNPMVTSGSATQTLPAGATTNFIFPLSEPLNGLILLILFRRAGLLSELDLKLVVNCVLRRVIHMSEKGSGRG